MAAWWRFGWWNLLQQFSVFTSVPTNLILLSHFSRVRLCATPQMAAHQAPPSLGFSRQERWSGLPFPSPMHASEKWKWSCSVVSNPQGPHGLQRSRLLRPWDFPGKSTGVGCHCSHKPHELSFYATAVRWVRAWPLEPDSSLSSSTSYLCGLEHFT